MSESEHSYNPERIRELLRGVDEDWNVFIYDDRALVELLGCIADRSFAEGVRFGSREDNELRRFLIERGGKR